MKELENKVKTAINLKYSKSKVYELFAKYENAYAKIKDPNAEQQHIYLDLYFDYLNYMQKREK